MANRGRHLFSLLHLLSLALQALLSPLSLPPLSAAKHYDRALPRQRGKLAAPAREPATDRPPTLDGHVAPVAFSPLLHPFPVVHLDPELKACSLEHLVERNHPLPLFNSTPVSVLFRRACCGHWHRESALTPDKDPGPLLLSPLRHSASLPLHFHLPRAKSRELSPLLAIEATAPLAVGGG